MGVLENHKVVSATFSNPQHDTIEVLWADEENVIRSHFIPANDLENADYKYLSSIGWDYERIIVETSTVQRDEIKALRTIHRFLAKDEVARLEAEQHKKLDQLKQAELEKSNIISAILNGNKDDEAVFRAKLAIFEVPAIKESKDKSLKTNIRKCTNLIDLIVLLKGHI